MYSILEKDYQTLQKSFGARERSHFIQGKGCRTVFLIITFLFITLSGSAASYYVSNSGNDSNAGTSPEKAWKTLKKVTASRFNAGDRILLKAGDSFDGPITIRNSGTSGFPIVVSTYGTGNKPIIYGDHPSATWSAVAGYTGLYESYINAPSVERVYDSSNNLYIKKIQGSNPLETWLSGFNPGNWGFTYTPQKIYVRTLDGNPPSQFRLLEWASVHADGAADYITFDNLDIRNGHMGIVISGGDNCIVQNCNVQDMWSMGIYSGVYLSNMAYNLEIANNTVTRTGWTSVYLYKGGNHWIHNNTISYAQKTVLGIAINGNELCGVGLQQGQNNLVENNNISYVKDSFVDYYLEVNSIVRYNHGFHAGCGAYPHGTGLKLYYNIFDLDGVGSGGIGVTHKYDPVNSPTTDTGPNYIYNNTLYNFTSYGIYSETGKSDAIIKNNLIIANSNVDLLLVNTGMNLDYNVYYNTAGNPGGWNWNNVKYTTLPSFQSVSGQDANSFCTNPLFTDAANGDFSLRTGSPAINKGTDVGLTKDILGNPIVGNPDIGAYEYDSAIDYEIPMVTGFSIPATSNSQLVSLSTFIASDNIGVTGYLITETATTPTVGASGWSSTKPINYSFSSNGTKTIYAWAKDAAGNVSTSLSASVIISSPLASTFTFTGSFSGNVNSASANFTVTPNNLFTGTITLTPSGSGSTGLSAKVLTFSNSSTAQTFTITPTVAGSIILTPTNNGSLTNPSSLTYTANAVAPAAPTSVLAVAKNALASVTFGAPINNGGSVVTGYAVTSIPAGGIDSNAGSTSLTHTITGLTNGTSYTFTVKATNYAGTSVASIVSNSVIPVEVVIKQGDITPSHFTTVWQGSNGLNHMNIIVASATLEDLPLSVNDEIAVFSGSACVGTAKLTKSIVPSDNTSFLTILASQSDGSNNGFIENDTILFKVWDNMNKVEKQINGIIYRNDVATWKTTGRYIPGSTSMVEITSYKVYTQSIELLKGYNMISTYVSAQNPNASAVTKTLVDQGNLIKMQDETGNSFENWGDFGGWINQLGSLEKTEGYKIQVANNCTLQVTGRPIAMPLNISLKTGWNIISFPRTDVVNAMNVVQTLIDQNKLVKVQDEAGNSIENWGLFGGWKNGIGNFIPGKAYKVKMNVAAILTFQESYPKSALVIAKTEQTEYYHSSVEGNGTDHMNINITGLNSIGISVGDELAAFDGAVCVATTKITQANLLSGTACLVPSFSTDNQYTNGFKVGDPIQISLWSILSGDESKVNTEVLNGQMKYEKNASVLVKMKSATIATGITNLDAVVKIDVFPNPSQGKITVRFSEIPEANSRVEISDISGRKLISRIVSGTIEEFNLESFTSGLYFVKSILGSSEYIQKLIVNK